MGKQRDEEHVDLADERVEEGIGQTMRDAAGGCRLQKYEHSHGDPDQDEFVERVSFWGKTAEKGEARRGRPPFDGQPETSPARAYQPQSLETANTVSLFVVAQLPHI